MVDPTEASSSAFNEASFKMKRLHELQDRINLCRQNPMVQTKLGRLAFRNHFDCLMSLYQEISAKCSTDERKDVKEKLLNLRKIVRQLEARTTLDSNIGLERKSEKKYELSHRKLRLQVEDGLFDVEELIRDYLDKHGFSTLTAESDEGDAYN